MSGNDRDPPEEPERRGFVEGLLGDSSSVSNLNGHFYRGEIDRTTAWRARLDRTTNWAVIVVAAILTWAFSGASNPHYVILIGMLAVTAFLLIETHRYREYDVWRRRVRLLQEHVFADLYARGPRRSDGWREDLSESIRNPRFTIPFVRAFAHRLRRIYFALLLILLAAWAARITVFVPEETWTETAAIPGVPGEVVAACVGLLYLGFGGLAAWFGRGYPVQEFEE